MKTLQRQTARWRTEALGGQEGSILIEVLVAIVLLGILILPLAGTVLSAAAQADATRQASARIDDSVPEDDALQAWAWGSRIAAAWWLPGPTLCVRPAAGNREPPIVGLWLDGWFADADNPGADGVVRLGPASWSGQAGNELVVRARTADSAWGPPWRSLVPGPSGVVPLAAQTGAGSAGNAKVVAHPPGAGNPLFLPSWDQSGVQPGPPGVPLMLPVPLSGPSGVSLESASQSWMTEPGRDFDVYF